MNVVGLISGGKDSIFNLCYSVALGHNIICLAHLSPRGGELETDSYMYQSVGSTVLPTIAECLDLPIIIREIKGTPTQTDLNYEHTQEDETEDLYHLLSDVLDKFPTVNSISCGAILSSYQKIRVENVAKRLNLRVLAYLWQQEQLTLYNQMIDSKISAMVIKTATFGLNRKHIGKMLDTLKSEFIDLYEKYQFHICGEGGEYETLTLDCPLYIKRIEIDEWELVVITEDKWAPVLIVKPLKWHTVEKFCMPSNKQHTDLNLYTLQERNINLNQFSPFSEIDNCRFYFPNYSDIILNSCPNSIICKELHTPNYTPIEHNLQSSDQWIIHTFNSKTTTRQLLDEIQMKIRQTMDTHKINQMIISFNSSDILNEFHNHVKEITNNYNSTLISYTCQYQYPAILQLNTTIMNHSEIQSSITSTSISLLTPPINGDEGFKQFIISNEFDSYFSPFFGIVPHTQKIVTKEQVSRFFDFQESDTFFLEIMMELLFSWRIIMNYLFLENNLHFDSIPYYLVFVSVDEKIFRDIYTRLENFLKHFISLQKKGNLSSAHTHTPCFTFLNVTSLPNSAKVQILPLFHAYQISKDIPPLDCVHHFDNEENFLEFHKKFNSSIFEDSVSTSLNYINSETITHISDISIFKAHNNNILISLKFNFQQTHNPRFEELFECIKTHYIESSYPLTNLLTIQKKPLKSHKVYINFSLFYTPTLFQKPTIYKSPQDWYNLVKNTINSIPKNQSIYNFSMQHLLVDNIETDIVLIFKFSYQEN